jgi:hypothetical protein
MFGLLYSKAPGGSKESNICLFGLMLSLASLLFLFLQQFANRLKTYRPEIAFFILALLWFILGAFIQGFAVLLVAAMGTITWRKPVVVITEDQIHFPSFPSKKWAWSELSNMMVKDAVLTIDLKNNQLIQTVVDPVSAKELDETMFNDFCQRHLLPKGI